MRLMKRNITAQTFTPSYDALEDRIRLSINYQDMEKRVDFMITRSFILNLLPTAEEFVMQYYGTPTAPVPQEGVKTKNEALSKTDFSNLELLQTGDELLTEVNFSFKAQTKQTLLTFNSQKTAAQIDLDGFMLTQIFQVIKSVIPRIKWGISHHF